MTILTQAVARFLLLPIFMFAVAILIKGYSDVGDGFGAGIIATLGIMLQYTALGWREAHRLPPVRLAPVLGALGLIVALLVAFLPLAWGREIMTHSPPPGAKVIHLGTLELLTAVAFDIGVFLLVFGFAVGAIDLIAQARSEADEQLPDPVTDRRTKRGLR